MYKVRAHAHLDYCDTIYHLLGLNRLTNLGVTINALMERIERIQYQSALATIGAWKGSNRCNLYEELE